jgi:hypothetical protein
MRRRRKTSSREVPRAVKRRCDHGLAVAIDPTDNELSELERMLAKCPNCSRWSPGDGPIMAVVLSR